MKLGTCVFLGTAGLMSLGLLGALGVQGCSSSSPATSNPDGGPTGDGGGPTGDGATVPSALPPLPPTGSTTPATGAENNFAVHHLHLGEEIDPATGQADWSKYGYNLDGKFTTAQSTDVCTQFPNTSKKLQTDGPGGLDNSFGANIAKLIATVSANPSQTISTSIGAGHFTVMIDVKGLNADPAQSSTGLSGQLFGGVHFDQSPNPVGSAPTFAKADVWPLDKTYLSSAFNGEILATPITSNVQFTGSYVTSGTYVNGPPTNASVTLSISGIALKINIKHAFVTFLHSQPGKLTGGIIAGVINTQDLITQLRNARGNIAAALCTGSTFDSVAAAIDSASDIMSDGSNNPGAQCDGISVGIGFDADEVALPQVGGEPVVGVDPCADAGAGDSGTVDSGTADTGTPVDSGAADATGE